MIPAIIAYRRPGPHIVAHAVGEDSDRTFCGLWATDQTDRHWPTDPDQWLEEHPPCGVCTTVVYS